MSTTPTGNQASINEWALAIAPAATPIQLGNWYAPSDESVGNFTGGLSWDTPTANRLIAVGPSFMAPETGTVSLQIYCRGGTNEQDFRLALYADNGSALPTHTARSGAVDAISAGSRPATLIDVTDPIVVASGAASAWRGASGDPRFPVTANTIYYLALWTENISSGAQVLLFNGGVNSARIVTNNGIANYHPSNDPSDPFPSSGSTSVTLRQDYAFRVQFYPADRAAPASVTTTQVTGVRATLTTWAAVSGADRYQIERTKDSVSDGTIAVVPGTATSFRDDDLEEGSEYEYTVTAWRGGSDGTPTTGAPVTITTAVRVAYATVTPSHVADSTRIDGPMRGLHGANVSVGGVTQYEDYQRFGFEWRALEPTLGNYTISPIISFLNSLSSGQRAWIRVRTSVPGNLNTLPADIPSDKYNDSGGARYPNWNDSYHVHPNGVSGRIQLWLNAIANLETSPGVKLKDDPRLGLIDMGVYAQFGEWTGDAGSQPASAATRQLIANAVLAAFSNQLVIMSATDTNTTTDEGVLWGILTNPRVIGFRQDALGRLTTPYMFQQFYRDRSLRLQNLMIQRTWWRTGEWFAAYTSSAADTDSILLALEDTTLLSVASIGGENHGNYASLGGTNQTRTIDAIRLSGYRYRVEAVRYPSPIALGNATPLSIAWRNVGNARIPETRQPQIQLRRNGEIVWWQTLSLDLSTLLPGEPTTVYSDTIVVSGIPVSGAGVVYDLCLQIPQVNTRRPAIPTALTGEQTGRYYVIAAGIQVIAANPVDPEEPDPEDPDPPPVTAAGAHIAADRVGETTTTTGTGPLTLDGAYAGHRRFSQVMNPGNTCWYAVVDSEETQWEVGLGTLQSATSLVRTAVLASSNVGALVEFAAGPKRVYITHPATGTPQFDPQGALLLRPVTTPAQPPAAAALYQRPIANRSTAHLVGPQGIEQAIGEAFWDGNTALYGVASSNVPATLGVPNNLTGTVTRPSIDASAWPLSAIPRMRYTSGTSPSATASWRSGVPMCWRGNDAGRGGFFMAATFGLAAVPASVTNGFVGVLAEINGISAGTQPSALINVIGIGFDRTQTTWRLVHNDGSGTATTVDLGADFPVDTSSAYRVWFSAAPNAGTVAYEVLNIGTNARVQGTITTDLPSGATFLAPQFYMSMNSGSTAVAFDIGNFYLRSYP